jgi:phosphoglycerol transferase MdoB-like AlkP superfamily enzyme
MTENSLCAPATAAAPNRIAPGSAAWRSGFVRAYRAIDIYLAFGLWFLFYWQLGEFFDFEANAGVFRLEFPLVIYLYFLFNQLLRPGRWRPLLAALPLFGAYGLHDLYLLVFNDIPDFIQVKEVPELFTVASLGLRAAMLALVALFLFFVLRLMHYPRRALVFSLPLLALVLGVLVRPGEVVRGIESGALWINPWVRSHNAAVNGRFVVGIYNESRRRLARENLAGHVGEPIQQERFAQELAFLKTHARRDRQVFFVVLESFLDPRLLKPLKGRDEYLDATFLERYDQALGYSISPRFAGGTAQAEFEILCGLPAFSEFEQTEFNLFTGNPAPCLPQVLGELGYDTLANYPYIPSFFNAERAYAGLGFQEAYFAREHTDAPTYLHLEQKGQYLFDGLLYQQNREFLRHRPKERPLFNYVLTLYGHMYFDVQRPLVWDPPTQDDYLKRIVNITYHRTGPLAEYLDWLGREYPKALIVAVGDHVPLLRKGPESYREMGYLDNVQDSVYHTNLLLIEDGRPKRVPKLHHFGIPYLVYDYLTDGGFCKAFHCPTAYPYDKEGLRDRYRYLLAEANQDHDRGPEDRRRDEALLAQRVRYLNAAPNL